MLTFGGVFIEACLQSFFSKIFRNGMSNCVESPSRSLFEVFGKEEWRFLILLKG